MSSSPIRPEAADLGTSLIHLTRMMHTMKQHAPSIHPAVEGAAYPVLFTLAAEPSRVTSVAESIHADPSTVSRLVSTLVTHGLVEKIADPEDGRAQVARLTVEGHDLLGRIRDRRNAWLTEILADWSDDDLIAAAAQIDRLHQTLATARSNALAGETPSQTKESV